MAVAAFAAPAALAGSCENQTSSCLVRASDFSIQEGKSFTGEIAQMRDYSGDGTKEFIRIDWGDGTVTNPTPPATGKHGAYVSVTATHKYARFGSYTTKVRLTLRKADGVTCPPIGCSFDGAQGTASVSDAPLTATGVDSTSPSRSFFGLVAKVTDANPDGVASDLSAVINWGDGSTSAGTIAEGAGGFGVGGTHDYVVGGPHTVVTTVTSKGGSHATASATVTVPRTPTSLVADPAILIITPLELRLGNLHAHLKIEGTNTPLPGKIVEFSAGGTFICADDTDETGTAHCDGLLPGGLAAILALGYDAVFKGDTAYAPSAAHGTLLGPGGPI